MNIKKVLVAFLLFASAAHAQTLAPPTAEFNAKPGKVSRGSFQVQNDSLQPVAFSVASYGVTLDSRGPHFHALYTGVAVETSPSSGRLGPKQIIRIDYRISCSILPCVVAIKTGMVSGHTSEVQVRHIIDHIVYLAQSKHPRRDILISAGLEKK